MESKEYMNIALSLAEKGRKLASPNPMVGAVVVKDNKIIGSGYHMQYGGPHAEVNAINMAGEEAKGATIYVTLEPCSHYGKTPPCAKLLIETGITEVYIGSNDPNPKVNGGGIKLLEDAGITVHTGINKEACDALNSGFFNRIIKGSPMYTSKVAMSLDGKIATKTGNSKWITNESARQFGHKLRAEHDAILAGIGTILADNPKLNYRGDKNYQPDCIVLDSKARTPIDANIFAQEGREVIIFVGENASKTNVEKLEQKGAKVYKVKKHKNEGLDLLEVNKKITEIGYNSVLIEGGSKVNAAFIESNLVNQIWVFIGDKLIGSNLATPALAGVGIESLEESPKLDFKKADIINNNIYILAEIKEG